MTAKVCSQMQGTQTSACGQVESTSAPYINVQLYVRSYTHSAKERNMQEENPGNEEGAQYFVHCLTVQYVRYPLEERPELHTEHDTSVLVSPQRTCHTLQQTVCHLTRERHSKLNKHLLTTAVQSQNQRRLHSILDNNMLLIVHQPTYVYM